MRIVCFLLGLLLLKNLPAIAQKTMLPTPAIHSREELLNADSVNIFIGVTNRFQLNNGDLIIKDDDGKHLLDVDTLNNVVTFRPKVPGKYFIRIKTNKGVQSKLLVADHLKIQ